MASDFVLYVASCKRTGEKRCKGSKECIRLLSSSNMDVFVQDIAKLEDVPSWLAGSPTLVCRRSKKAYTGQKAIDYIKNFQSAGAEDTGTLDDSFEPPLEVKDDEFKKGKVTQEDVVRLMEERKMTTDEKDETRKK